MRRPIYIGIALCWCVISLAEDPLPPTPPKPDPIPVKIVAPKEVSGIGTKAEPFLFTPSTRCILELTGDVVDPAKVRWDKDDAPGDIEIIAGRYASFSLYRDGVYQLTAHGGDIYSKVWFQIHSGLDPPGPQPPGPTPPGPTPTVGKLWVVIIKDGAKLTQLPSSQMQALLSTKIRDYCDAHCFKGTDGKTTEFKIYEKDTDVSRQSPDIQKAFKTAVDDLTKSGGSGPWLTVSNGKYGFSGPLPPTEAAVLDKLKIYGGE